jgi:hypothetical protein
LSWSQRLMAAWCGPGGAQVASLLTNQSVAAGSLYSRSQFGPLYEERSRPVSRVLSRAIIPLWTPVTEGLKRPTRKRARNDAALSVAAKGCFPIWPCSTWGLPSRRVLPPTRCALTAPFHPYRPQPVAGRRLRRFALCCTFRGLTPPRRYLARYSREPGLSSPSQPMECSDCPADFAAHHTALRLVGQRPVLAFPLLAAHLHRQFIRIRTPSAGELGRDGSGLARWQLAHQ